jgi:hypothetical protein
MGSRSGPVFSTVAKTRQCLLAALGPLRIRRPEVHILWGAQQIQWPHGHILVEPFCLALAPGAGSSVAARPFPSDVNVAHRCRLAGSILLVRGRVHGRPISGRRLRSRWLQACGSSSSTREAGCGLHPHQHVGEVIDRAVHLVRLAGCDEGTEPGQVLAGVVRPDEEVVLAPRAATRTARSRGAVVNTRGSGLPGE